VSSKPGAGHVTGRLIKIGHTSDVADRERTLCSEPYANFSDWRIVASVWIDKRGNLEDRTLARLDRYKVRITSVREGQDVVQKEVRNCSFEIALEALAAELDGMARQREINLVPNWKVYNW
jgi:hypothetical protein